MLACCESIVAEDNQVEESFVCCSSLARSQAACGLRRPWSPLAWHIARFFSPLPIVINAWLNGQLVVITHESLTFVFCATKKPPTKGQRFVCNVPNLDDFFYFGHRFKLTQKTRYSPMARASPRRLFSYSLRSPVRGRGSRELVVIHEFSRAPQRQKKDRCKTCPFFGAEDEIRTRATVFPYYSLSRGAP